MSDQHDETRVGGAEAPPAPGEQASESVLSPVDGDEAADEQQPDEQEAMQHAAGELDVPGGLGGMDGAADGAAKRAGGIVVSRFNGGITQRLLAHAISELDELCVNRPNVTVMPVPGAFELPLAAMALAKTRRYACIVALGCIIRGETPHFDFVASEAASGLQLAALETGVPVAFGVLTVDVKEQAVARISKGAEAVRTALEMADAFAQLRATAR